MPAVPGQHKAFIGQKIIIIFYLLEMMFGKKFFAYISQLITNIFLFVDLMFGKILACLGHRINIIFYFFGLMFAKKFLLASANGPLIFFSF